MKPKNMPILVIFLTVLKQFLADQSTGLSLREMIHQFKSQTLVLFKGLLLQPKVFSTRNTQKVN
jgi:hypothetical protein